MKPKKYTYLQFTLPGTSFKWESHCKAVWDNGTTLEILDNGRGHIESNGIGFPVRFSGDAFHALRMGIPLPERCKAW